MVCCAMLVVVEGVKVGGRLSGREVRGAMARRGRNLDEKVCLRHITSR